MKRDNNNVYDFLESEGYIRLKADSSISSKELYEIYGMWCEENSLTALKRRSFSDAVIASQGKYHLEYCNKIINAAGRRVWGFYGIEAVARPNINGFFEVSERTYRRNGGIDSCSNFVYVCTQRFTPKHQYYVFSCRQVFIWRLEIRSNENRKLFDLIQKSVHGNVLP